MRRGRHAVALAAILALAAALRLVDIGTGWFGADQARDLTIAADVIAGRGWPLAGPVMRNQIRLGGVYYGFWVPPFALGGGARAAYLWAGLLGTAGVMLAARLGLRAGGPACGLAGALLLATAPIAVIDERVAWPPALVPLVTGLILLLALDQRERPSPLRALLLGGLCGLATQVHLSLVPIAALGLGSIVLARQARTVRNFGLAVLAFLLPIVPMLLVAGEPLATAPQTQVVLPSLANRIAAVLVAPMRAVGAVAGDAPALIATLLGLEAVWLPLALGCAVVVAWRGELPLRLVGLALLVSVAAVVALPAEAWAYYLDAALLPASVVLGWAVTRWRSAAVPWVLVGLALARVTVLSWWIGDVAQRGFIFADFEQLALAEPALGQGRRVRLLTLATKEQVWPRLLDRAGGDPARVAARLHGPGFADLATDNAYFEGRAVARALAAAARAPAGLGSRLLSAGSGGHGGRRPGSARPGPALEWPAAERDVALFYPDGLDPGFLGGADVETIGPFVSVTLPLRLRPERGRIVVCDGRTVSLPWPRVPALDPRNYGRGEIARPRWPCARVRVEIPIEGAGPWRLLAALRGAGQIVAGNLRAEGRDGDPERPQLEPLGAMPPGFDRGWAVPARAVALLLEIDIDGPATLDFVALPALRGVSRVKASSVRRSGGPERPPGLGIPLS